MSKTIRKIVKLFMMLIEVLLAFRLVLRLLGANANSYFVSWIYQTSSYFLSPFSFVFPSPNIKGKFVLEFTTIFAIFFYLFVAYLVDQILKVVLKK